jgi:hypothetical protein
MPSGEDADMLFDLTVLLPRTLAYPSTDLMPDQRP